MTENPKILPLPKDYTPPEGGASVTSLNERSVNALNRLRVRGLTPQGNPLLTSFQMQALITVLARKGALSPDDLNDFQYEIVRVQTESLEAMLDAAPSGIVVPAGN